MSNDVDNMLTYAYERNTKLNLQPKDFQIQNLSELAIFQQSKRTQFESSLRLNPLNWSQWIQYAQFELNQHDIFRARSIVERALEYASFKEVKLWMFYIQFETKLGFISHARNLLHRSTKILPMVNKLWFQWLGLEERVIGAQSCIPIFESWLKVNPNEDDIWTNYIDLQLRLNSVNGARLIYQRFVKVHPLKGWESWIDMELKLSNNEVFNIRNVFSLAVNALYRSNELHFELVQKWIEWEITVEQWDDVKKLLKFSESVFNSNDFIDYQLKIKRKLPNLFFLNNKNDTEIVLSQLELSLRTDQFNYLLWWQYLEQLKTTKQAELSQLINKMPAPKDSSKSQWTKFIYIHLNYLLYTEVSSEEKISLESHYKHLISLIPSSLDFPILDTAYGDYLLRNNNDLKPTRSYFGQCIGKRPHSKLIKHYINIEKSLGNSKRVRLLYQKMIGLWPARQDLWLEYLIWEIGREVDIDSIIVNLIKIDEISPDVKRQILKGLDDVCDASNLLSYWQLLTNTTNLIEDKINTCLQSVKSNDKAATRDLFNYYLSNLSTTEGLKLLNTWKKVEIDLFEDEEGTNKVITLMNEIFGDNEKDDDEDSGNDDEDSGDDNDEIRGIDEYSGESTYESGGNDFQSRFEQ